jgi:hypothetical protein
MEPDALMLGFTLLLKLLILTILVQFLAVAGPMFLTLDYLKIF